MNLFESVGETTAEDTITPIDIAAIAAAGARRSPVEPRISLAWYEQRGLQPPAENANGTDGDIVAHKEVAGTHIQALRQKVFGK